jgi:hypothetical protein
MPGQKLAEYLQAIIHRPCNLIELEEEKYIEFIKRIIRY